MIKTTTSKADIRTSKQRDSRVRKRNIDKHGQMIVIMGIILAISVFMIASIAAEVSNLDVVVATESSTYLLTEFNRVKETFSSALNYNLVNIEINTTGPPIGAEPPGPGVHPLKNESILKGDMNKIHEAFNQTRDEYTQLELRYGRFFDARLNSYWYSHRTKLAEDWIRNTVYKVKVTLFLENGKARITEDVTYSIVLSRMNIS